MLDVFKDAGQLDVPEQVIEVPMLSQVFHVLQRSSVDLEPQMVEQLGGSAPTDRDSLLSPAFSGLWSRSRRHFQFLVVVGGVAGLQGFLPGAEFSNAAVFQETHF